MCLPGLGGPPICPGIPPPIGIAPGGGIGGGGIPPEIERKVTKCYKMNKKYLLIFKFLNTTFLP